MRWTPNYSGIQIFIHARLYRFLEDLLLVIPRCICFVLIFTHTRNVSLVSSAAVFVCMQYLSHWAIFSIKICHTIPGIVMYAFVCSIYAKTNSNSNKLPNIICIFWMQIVQGLSVECVRVRVFYIASIALALLLPLSLSLSFPFAILPVVAFFFFNHSISTWRNAVPKYSPRLRARVFLLIHLACVIYSKRDSSETKRQR